MSNQPKHNPNKDRSSQTTIPNRSTPDGQAAQQQKVVNPPWSRDPDSTHSINSAKSSNPSMPWTEPEIDEVGPFGPGSDQAD